jgi:hypothetical protein
VNQCALIVPEIDLILYALGGIDNRLDGRFHKLSGVHVDVDFVADVELPWRWIGLFRHGAIVRHPTEPPCYNVACRDDRTMAAFPIHRRSVHPAVQAFQDEGTRRESAFEIF